VRTEGVPFSFPLTALIGGGANYSIPSRMYTVILEYIVFLDHILSCFI
jgi:hypothetical protein